MRYLAVDYGTKRIGLAECDELEFAAYPLLTLTRSRSLRHDLEEIARLARKQRAEAIVVGLPLNADGSRGPSAEAAAAFARSLGKHTKLPLHLHDEFLTTAEAEEALIAADVSRKRRREVIDQVAAVFLLESFLRARREATDLAARSVGRSDIAAKSAEASDFAAKSAEAADLAGGAPDPENER